ATLATIAVAEPRTVTVLAKPRTVATLATLVALLAVTFSALAARALRLGAELVQTVGHELREHALTLGLRKQLLEDLTLEIARRALHATDQDLDRVRRLRDADGRQRNLELADEDVVLGDDALFRLDAELEPDVAEVPQLARTDERDR